MNLRQWLGIGGILLGGIGITTGIARLVNKERPMNVEVRDYTDDNIPDIFLDNGKERKVFVAKEDGSFDETKYVPRIYRDGSATYYLISMDRNRIDANYFMFEKNERPKLFNHYMYFIIEAENSE